MVVCEWKFQTLVEAWKECLVLTLHPSNDVGEKRCTPYRLIGQRVKRLPQVTWSCHNVRHVLVSWKADCLANSNITTKCAHMCYCDTMRYWDYWNVSLVAQSAPFFSSVSFCWQSSWMWCLHFTSSWLTMRWRCLWRWIQARKLAGFLPLSKAMRICLRIFGYFVFALCLL